MLRLEPIDCQILEYISKHKNATRSTVIAHFSRKVDDVEHHLYFLSKPIYVGNNEYLNSDYLPSLIGFECVTELCFLTYEGQIALREYHLQIGKDKDSRNKRRLLRGILMFIATSIGLALLNLIRVNL